MMGVKISIVIGVIVVALGWESDAIAQSTKTRLAFNSPCLERGDTDKHENVINPLQSEGVLCNPELIERAKARRETIANFNDGITLCNWNVYGLPVKNSGRRQRNIADYVSYGCDIFSGQEHWILFDRSAFRGRSRQKFPGWNFKYFGHPLKLHPGSGILIASVWPIQKTKYSPWPGGLFRNAAYKGVGYAQIKTPQGLLDVYNLHLAAGRAVELKERQLEHLVEFVERTHDPTLPLVINGDFNFGRNWRLPSRQMRALDWLQDSLDVRPVGFTSRIEYTLLNDRLRYLDHRVLADWDSREVFLSQPFIRQFADHPGIVTRVVIQAP